MNMKKLVLYSDQIIDKTKDVDVALLNLLNQQNPKIGYIPSCSDLTRKYFNERIDYYKTLGITDLFYFDLDKGYDEKKTEELLSCDAFLLSGGNTFYFLFLLKKRNFVGILKEYVSNGGILIGVSAGAMLMSETIEIAELIDEDSKGLEDKESLGLVDFEFMPHWEQNRGHLNELLEYSKRKERIIYVCNDGDGIIVNDDRIKFIGNIIKIENGQAKKVNSKRVNFSLDFC